MKFILLLFILLCTTFYSFSQSQIIFLKDKYTTKPLPYANVVVDNGIEGASGKTLISDEQGRVFISIKKPITVSISYLGYKSISAIIQNSKDTILNMQPDVFNLDPFEVTSSGNPIPSDKSVYNIKFIGNKEIDAKGANTLNELLNTQGNIKISNDGALGSSISLHGLSGEHVKILIDGIPVVGRKNGNIDLSQINLQNVDHVELIEGPMSVNYGSNALGGVINIITKEQKGTKFDAYATSYLESVGVYNFSAGSSFCKNGHSFGVDIGRNFFDGFSTTQSRDVQWNPKRQWNANLKYGYSFKNQSIKLSTTAFNELVLDKGALRAPYFETAFDQYFYTSRFSARGDYNLKLKKDKSFNTIASYSYYNSIKNTYLKDLTTLNQVQTQNPDQHDTTVVNSLIIRGVFSDDYTKKNFNYAVGYDLSQEKALGKRILDNQQSINDYAGFVNFKYLGIKNFVLQPGFRYGFNSKYKMPLVYSFNAYYKNEKMKVRASYAKGFRAPSIKELYLSFHDINHNIYGNANLKAEYSNNVNANFTYDFRREKSMFTIDGELFYNNIKNVITLALMPNGSYSYTNLNKYITKGFDIGFKYNIFSCITTNASYGLTGVYSSVDELETAKRSFLYSSSFTFNVEYQIVKTGISISAYYKYNGKTPQVVLNSTGELSQTYIPTYNTLDLSASKKLFNNKLAVTIGAKNLFNNTMLNIAAGNAGIHSGGNEIPIGWGRTAFLKLTYSI